MTHDAAVLEDGDRLQKWLAERGLVPYVDFEILGVLLEEGSLELDPMGRPERLTPLLDAFAAEAGFVVLPFDPDTGTVSLVRHRSGG